MIEFKVESNSYSMPTSWQDVPMKTFIRFQKIIQMNETMSVGDEWLLQNLFEALCDVEPGTFDELTYGTVVMLNPHLAKFNNTFPTGTNTTWDIGGVLYTYNIDPTKYTLADFADIKTIQANSKQNLDYLGEIAAIMIRPAVKCLDEAGNEYYKLTKRSSVSDEANKKVILEMNCVDVMTVVNFFLNTMKG